MTDKKVISLEALEQRFRNSAQCLLKTKDVLENESTLSIAIDRALTELMATIGLCQMATENAEACNMIERQVGCSVEFHGVPVHYFNNTVETLEIQNAVDERLPEIESALIDDHVPPTQRRCAR